MSLFVGKTILKLLKDLKASLLATGVTLLLFPVYKTILNYFSGFSDHMFVAVTSTLLHLILFLGINGLFMFMHKIEYFKRFKIPRKEYQVPSESLVRKAVLDGVLSTIANILPTFYIWYGFQYFGSPVANSNLPSISTMVLQYTCCILFNEASFMLFHSILHVSPFLYKHIHKQHHEFNGSIGFAAEYAHPLEHLLADSIPTIGGCMLGGVHPLVFFVWLAWRLEETYESHSGFAFKIPFVYDTLGLMYADHALHHDAHHSENCGNYGMPYWDDIFGTSIVVKIKSN